MKKMIISRCVIIILVIILIAIIAMIINGINQNKKLFVAIENNDYVASQEAINSGAFINFRKNLFYIAELVPTNPTPLIAACKNGNRDIVELLLEKGADINKRDNFTGKTPLLAALHGSKQNRFELAMYLIDNGADIYASQKTTSPFEEALIVLTTDDESTIAEGFDLFRYLMKQNVNMNICTGNENVLTFAAHYNNYNVVKYLIENNYYDIDSFDSSGETALIVATKNNRIQIVELLLKLGANKTIKDSEGKIALDYAICNDYYEIISLLETNKTGQ